MFKKILVALDHTPSDAALIPQISELAKLAGAELLLVHVADGWAARNFEQLSLAESEEIKDDRAYLETLVQRMRGEGLAVEARLALGDPPAEILKVAEEQACDLIAMTTHGHRLIGDIIHGETIEKVRHRATVPLFVVRSKSA